MAGGGRPSALVLTTLPWAAEAVVPWPGCCEQPVNPCMVTGALLTPSSSDSGSPVVEAPTPMHGPSLNPTSSAPPCSWKLGVAANDPPGTKAHIKDGRASELPTITCGASWTIEPRRRYLWHALVRASPTAPSFGTPDGSAPDPLSPGHLMIQMRGG